MNKSDNRNKGVRHSASQFVFVVPLLLISGFACFSFIDPEPGNKPISDLTVSTEPPSNLSPHQSVREGMYSHTNRAPKQLADPDEVTTKPALSPETPAGTDKIEKERKKDERLVMPEWDKIFNPGGTFKDEVNGTGGKTRNGIADYIDLYSGTQADFIQDNISNGLATDMSALLGAAQISDEVLYNGEVNPAHDLGNSYFLASKSIEGHTRVFLGIERLFVPVDSYIEIEFNQGLVQLGSGTNWWEISGERTDGDLLVRMDFSAGRLSFIAFEVWQGSVFSTLDAYSGSPGKGCLRQEAFVYCGGTPPITHPSEGFELWDTNFNRVQPTPPNDFVQVGIDVMRLTGMNMAFRGLLIRTPEDISINGFYTPREYAYSGAH